MREDGTIAEGGYDFSQPVDRDLTLKAKWVPLSPAFDCTQLMNDGRIGLLFHLGVPEVEGIDWQGSYMEMHVAGKGGQTSKMPLEDATVAKMVFLDDCATPVDGYLFECPSVPSGWRIR